MNVRTTLLAAVALAASLAALTHGRWGAGGNHDLAALARAVRHGDDLEDHLEAIRRRHEARRALAAEVVAGRMSLHEAADHFRHLDEADRGYSPGLPRPLRDERAFRADVLTHGRLVLAHQGRFAAAARCYDEAFAAHPQLLRGPPTGHRYWAACAAARAGCGQGRDAADLDEKSCAAFRRQALDWLRAELDSWRRLLVKEPGSAWLVARDLPIWLEDPHFAGVREPEALARLPAAERQAWQKLWADVADTLARAAGRIPPPPQAGGK
jgi:hypothetical protein